MNRVVVSGKKKTAVARVKIVDGSGKIFFNGENYEKLGTFHRLAIKEPVAIYTDLMGDLNFDIQIKTSGGGKEGQIQAARLGVAKALVKHSNSQELKKAMVNYDRGLLVADVRRKETYKPGDSKARAKRQKSYR